MSNARYLLDSNPSDTRIKWRIIHFFLLVTTSRLFRSARKFEIFVLRIKELLAGNEFHGIPLMDEYGSLNSAILGCKIVKETKRARVDANDSSRGIKSNSYDVIKEKDGNIWERKETRAGTRIKNGRATYGNLKRHSFIKQTHIKFNEALPYSLTNFRLPLWLSHGYWSTMTVAVPFRLSNS